MKHILFICLGNICRSPAAEEVMRVKLAQCGEAAHYVVDSAGMIDYHEGELPDSRMRHHAAARGYRLTHHSRPVCVADFDRFDLVVAMDHDNLRCLERFAQREGRVWREVVLLADYLRHHQSATVPDPYYGGPEAFELALDLIEDGCDGLCEALMARTAQNE